METVSNVTMQELLSLFPAAKITTVRLTFLEPMLGTLPADEQIYRDYIATKNPNRTAKKVNEEVEALSEEVMTAQEEAGRPITAFARAIDKEGRRVPAVYGYVLKGMFKNACSALKDCEGTLSNGFSAYKKKIDQRVFVYDAEGKSEISIINLSEDVYKDGLLPICERPLRAQTPQGERVAISASEEVPAGSTVDFTVVALNEETFALVFEWLNYGRFNGLGCWHNSGKGRFTYEIISGNEKPDVKPVVKKKASKAAATEEVEEEAPKKRGRKKKDAE